jgi:hypothetical protein
MPIVIIIIVNCYYHHQLFCNSLSVSVYDTVCRSLLSRGILQNQ